jgi:hypothetical protein
MKSSGTLDLKVKIGRIFVRNTFLPKLPTLVENATSAFER